MAAVLRVKRLLEEEPLDALIINCKRRKIEGDAAEIEDSQLSAVLKFAATIKSQDEDIYKHIKTSAKNEAEENFKKHSVNIREKLKEEQQIAVKDSRYKVINCFRSNDPNLEAARVDSSKESNAYTIFDIESDKISLQTTSEPKYVYDLYYTNSDDFGDAELNDISIFPFSDNLVYGSSRDNGEDANDSDDSEDSNAESNWRNDYPNESDMESVNEEDMVDAMNRVAIEDDLSSDCGEESYIYGSNSEGMGLEEDLDEGDVARYGKMYAKFKAKAKNMEKDSGRDYNFYYGDIDDEEKQDDDDSYCET